MKAIRFVLPLMLFSVACLLMQSCSTSENNEANGTETEASSDDDSYKPAASSARNIGVGPVKHVDIGAIDANRVQIGKDLFEAKCVSCHKLTADRLVGPGLKGVTQRREPEWIMNQILDPAKMTAEDSVAKELLATYMTQMTNQNVTEEQARNLLEYFRSNDTN
jgi:mono/diheme cytochrome c family protein